jgi:predicted 3-demethylubiquinone-9 3-methyltransferase (glyoxalase superfamily)
MVGAGEVKQLKGDALKIDRQITPCLWFDAQAEEAAHFYTSIFKNSRIGKISRYGKEGVEIHGRPEKE